MEVTKVNFKKVEKGNLKGFADVEFDNCFVVRGFKILEGSKGVFVANPSEKGGDGQYYDTSHPITSEMREKLSNAVLKEANLNSNSSGSGNDWFDN